MREKLARLGIGGRVLDTDVVGAHDLPRQKDDHVVEEAQRERVLRGRGSGEFPKDRPRALNRPSPYIGGDKQANRTVEMPSIVEEIIRGLERPSVSGCVGITTWIKKALMANRKFRVAGPALKKGPAGRAESTADRGLHIGRITDHAVARYYAGKIKRSRVNDIRARRIIDHIERKLELRCVATQLPVTLDEFKIKTAIDLVAVRKSKPDTVVVLEIKTTQFPLAKHNQR